MIYDLILAVGVLGFLPRILWRKKLPTLRQRLGLDLPKGTENGFWIHAVSVGEVKSAKGLVEKIRSEHPKAFILITTATATGLEEAKRSLKTADAYHFLPLDFRFILRRWMNALKPRALIIVESDFWYNLLRESKKIGATNILVSGKVSPRSANRFKTLAPLSRKLFSLFDLILVQNQDYQEKFAPFADSLIGGNLKLDAKAVPVNPTTYAHLFQGVNILLSCTHVPEEEELLDALQEIQGTLFIAPRHPERYNEVAALLEAKNIPYQRWSQLNAPTSSRVVLIDSMGQLPIFYTFCQLAIVAGSFGSRIGGHNILEPILYGTPVFFGPHMHQQTELTNLILNAKAGIQTSLQDLSKNIQEYLKNPENLRQAATHLSTHRPSALEVTWEEIRKKI